MKFTHRQTILPTGPGRYLERNQPQVTRLLTFPSHINHFQGWIISLFLLIMCLWPLNPILEIQFGPTIPQSSCISFIPLAKGVSLDGSLMNLSLAITLECLKSRNIIELYKSIPTK